MSRQLIGLTGPSVFTQECIDMIEEYYDADFVMLYQNNSSNLERWVDRCDGIILAGGVDIHPTVYDQSIWNGQSFSKFDLKRDIREVQIINRCKKTKKPFLGICRGHQLIGVTYGYFLIPDLGNASICHQPARQNLTLEKNEPMHFVTLVDEAKYHETFNSRDPEERLWFKRIMGFNQNTKLWTNSFHHQGLAYPTTKKQVPQGAGEVVIYGVARVDMSSIKVDKIIELMGTDDWVSCQWHPEYDWRINSASRAVLERFKTLLQKDRKRPAPKPPEPKPEKQESKSDSEIEVVAEVQSHVHQAQSITKQIDELKRKTEQGPLKNPTPHRVPSV